MRRPHAALALAAAIAERAPEDLEVVINEMEPHWPESYTERDYVDGWSSRRGRRSMEPKPKRRLFRP